jgi:hypothetical protein
MVASGEMLAQQIHRQASRGVQEGIENEQDQSVSASSFRATPTWWGGGD